MKTFRTRPVPPDEEETFWSRAEECWELALLAAERGRWSGCVINAIHTAIALSDLMGARFAGKRYAGTSHDEAIQFYSTLGLEDEEFPKSVRRLGQILSLKTLAEYDGSPVTETQARQLLKNAERFREYIFQKLKRRSR